MDGFSIVLIIIVSLLSIGFIAFLLGRYFYRLKHGLPVGECAYCHTNKDKILKQYHKKFGCQNCKNN